MCAHKSSTFSKPSPSNLQSPQGRIPASGTDRRKLGTHADGGRIRPEADLRLSIVDCLFAKGPSVVAAHTNILDRHKAGVEEFEGVEAIFSLQDDAAFHYVLDTKWG